MTVERVEQDGDVIRVYGRFDRLDGVGEEGCFRLSRGQYAWTNLVVIDRTICSVLVTNHHDPDIKHLRVGESYTWFRDYWSPPFVEAIADQTNEWRQFTFQPSDAAYYRQDELIAWRQVGSPLPEGAVELYVKPGGWDHEHCGLCGDHIDSDHPIAYQDAEGFFLCATCFERYGAIHDVSFQMDA